MAVKPKSYAVSVADDWKEYAAGTYDLTDGTFGPARCARRIVPKAAGNFSALDNADGVNKPVNGFAAGYIHDGHVQSITSDVAFVAFW